MLSTLFFFFVSPFTPPWEPSGRLILAVRASPSASADLTLLLGIDNVELYRRDGGTQKVTVRSRRVTLEPGNDDLALVLDTQVPVGDYSGFGFKLTSPELRNPWQEDEAPGHISLVGDAVRLDSSYHIDEGVTSAIILAFETLTAIHEKDDTQLYLPVIQIETRSNADASIENEKAIQIQGGRIEHSATYGMDWDGRMRFNFRARKQVEPTSSEILPETPLEDIVDVQEEETSTTTATSTPQTDEGETLESETDGEIETEEDEEEEESEI